MGKSPQYLFIAISQFIVYVPPSKRKKGSPRMDYIVMNEVSQDWTPATQEVWGWRTKIEEFHREDKQPTSVDRCQCRRARIVLNHQLCHVGMGASETSRLRDRSDDLSSQAWYVVQLSSPATSFTLDSDGPCVNPDIL